MARLTDVFTQLATGRSLGQIYHAVWRAVGGGAKAAKRHEDAPQDRMTTYAVNQLERRRSAQPTRPSNSGTMRRGAAYR